jgi:hypothetical protein
VLNTNRLHEFKLVQQDFCLVQRMAVPLKLRDQLALPLKPPLAFEQMLFSPFKVSRSVVRVAGHVLKLPGEGDCSRRSPNVRLRRWLQRLDPAPHERPTEKEPRW